MKPNFEAELKRNASLTIALARTIAANTLAHCTSSGEVSGRISMLIEQLDALKEEISHNWTT